MQYRKEIDGLRALAVIPVILFHANFPLFSGGYVGVDVFFVISGYLITSLILQEHAGGGFSLLRFYERRARRILPALFLVMACCVPFALLWALPTQLENFARSVVAVVFFVSNILLWRESGYFSAGAEELPLLHTWSLAVEEQFYIVFPLVMMLLLGLARRWLWIAFIVAAAVSLGIAEWGWRYHSIANFYLAPSRAWELLIGGLCALYLRERQGAPRSGLLSLLGLGLIVYAVFAFQRATPFPSLFALVPTLGTAMIILFCRPGTIAHRLLGSPPLVGIGLISYSAYLWHQPLLAFARIRFGDIAPAVAAVLCLAALGLAYVSWRFVEIPFRKRQVVGVRKLVFTLAPASLCLLLAAASMIRADGFIERYAPADRQLVSMTPQSVGRYVNRRFDRLHLADFKDNRKIRLLVIGDSFGKDLVNAIYESSLAEQFQVSTYHISARCGNLMLGIDFSGFIKPHDLPRCRLEGWYENPELQARMQQAEVIWLASSWRNWQSELLPQSVSAIQRAYDARVLVLSRKTFGKIDLRELLALSPAERRQRDNELAAETVADITALGERLPPGVYVDAQALMCEGRTTCPVFSPSLELISFDGGHLTKGGAAVLGERLANHPLVADLIKTARR